MDANLLHLLDPELRDHAVQMQPMMEQFLPMTLDKLETWRSLMESNCPPPLAEIEVERQEIPTATGSPNVTVHLVNANCGQSRPGILHMHGGGFFAGSAQASLRQLQETARSLDCTVVTVDYRLAPEVPYSGSVEDNYAALCWMHDNAEAIGVDRRRIAIMGESAGGGHAVLLSAAARERGGPSILFQALSYPMLDDRTGTTRPTPHHIGAIGWDADTNRFGWRCFLGREPGGDDAPSKAVPARIKNLDGMPPTFIGVGALDLFVKENIEFANRLIQIGIPTEFLVVPGAFHAFDTVVEEAMISKRFTAAKTDALRRAFSAPTPG